MNIRYINLGEISGWEMVAEHEITKYIEPSQPLFIAYTPDKPVLTMTGYYNVNKYLYKDKIPKDVELLRIYSQRVTTAGSICWDKNTIVTHLHIKNDWFPEKLDIRNMRDWCLNIIIKTLKSNGIDACLHPSKKLTNDVVILQDGKYKKVGAIWVNGNYREGWKTIGYVITLKPNYELMEKVYRLDTQKMAKISKIKNIRDAVGDIDMLGNKYDKNLLMRELAENVSKELDCNIENSKLSNEERKVMNGLKEVVKNKEWIDNAKRPAENLKQEKHKFKIEYV